MKMAAGVAALVSEAAPLVAFAPLAVLHPVGDPQESKDVIVRFLDFQGTYWIRAGILFPPPLLALGFIVSAILAWKGKSEIAHFGSLIGLILLSCWALLMIVPLLIHVN
jgi:hypothetical protein